MTTRARTTDQAGGRLPFEPLLDVLPIDPVLARPDVHGPGVPAQAAALLGVTPRSIHRYRREGLSPHLADRLAIAAGSHPILVWGQSWVDAISADNGRTLSEARGTYVVV